MNAPIILLLLQARHRGHLEDTVRQCLERRKQYQRVRLVKKYSYRYLYSLVRTDKLDS